MDDYIKLFLLVFMTPILIISGMVVIFVVPDVEGYFVWGIIIFIALIGILLLAGRATWLIAGYNTMPETWKERYDVKKLSFTVGAIFLLSAIAFGSLFLDAIPFEASVSVLLIFVIVLILAAIGRIRYLKNSNLP